MGSCVDVGAKCEGSCVVGKRFKTAENQRNAARSQPVPLVLTSRIMPHNAVQSDHPNATGSQIQQDCTSRFLVLNSELKKKKYQNNSLRRTSDSQIPPHTLEPHHGPMTIGRGFAPPQRMGGGFTQKLSQGPPRIMKMSAGTNVPKCGEITLNMQVSVGSGFHGGLAKLFRTRITAPEGGTHLLRRQPPP